MAVLKATRLALTSCRLSDLSSGRRYQAALAMFNVLKQRPAETDGCALPSLQALATQVVRVQFSHDGRGC